MPDEIVGGDGSVPGNLHRFRAGDFLPHPFPGGFRRQDQRPAVMNIDKTAIGGSGHQQKSFGAIPAFEGRAANSGHKYRLTILALDEVGLLFLSGLFPLKPAVGEADRPPVLPQRFEHPAGGCGLNAGVDQRGFIPPSWRITPVNGIEVELRIPFTQE